MKRKFLLVCLLLVSLINAQSKKEQIEILTVRIDSLNDVLKIEKKYNKLQNDMLIHKMDSLNDLIKIETKTNLNNSIAISELNSNYNSINSDLSKLKQEFSSIILKMDTLTSLVQEFLKLKQSTNPVIEEINRTEYLPFKFWNITIGKSDSLSVANYLRMKKAQGLAVKLGSYVWSSSSIGVAISAQGKIRLDNILSYNCDEINYCFDKNNICYEIQISFYGSDEDPSNLFYIILSDMEKMINSKATIKTISNINDDKCQIATIKKDGVTIVIRKNLEIQSSTYVTITSDIRS